MDQRIKVRNFLCSWPSCRIILIYIYIYIIPLDFSTSPKVIIVITLQHVQEVVPLGRIVHRDHFHAEATARATSLIPSIFGSSPVLPLDIIVLTVVLHVGHTRVAVGAAAAAGRHLVGLGQVLGHGLTK
jgi:hypothetical protein